MKSGRFKPSHENIKRAERKLVHLEGSINAFLDSCKYAVRAEKQSDTVFLIARRDKCVPADLAFDALEIVQRLRAALDKAIVALVEANGRGCSGVGFPFGGLDRNTGRPNPFPDPRWDKQGGLKRKLSGEQWLFVESQKPYPGGNDVLWAINEVANVDKHRNDLVEVRCVLGYELGLTFGDGGGAYLSNLQLRSAPADGNHLLQDPDLEHVMLAVKVAPSQKLKIDQRISTGLVFGPVEPVAGRNVLGTLDEQIRLTKEILAGFELLT